MGRSRRRRGRGPQFRAWGLLLSVVVVLFVSQQAWLEATWVSIVLLFYLLVVRLTRCRVETLRGRPCLWRVRGLFGVCDYHAGYKRSMPTLTYIGGLSLPMLMWPRPDWRDLGARPEPQPSPGATETTARRAGKPSYDRGMMVLAVASLLVTFVAFIRDLLAG